MRGTFNPSTILTVALCTMAIFQSSEATFFKTIRPFSSNTCLLNRSTSSRPIKVWPYVTKLTSTHPIAKEVKSCIFRCLSDPKCLYSQVVRLATGKGFCHTFDKAPELIQISEKYCKGFVRAEKKFDCFIRWNPDNFLRKNNTKVFRVEKLDKSWTIFNETRGIHLFEMNSTKCAPARHSVFDTVRGTTEQNNLKSYLSKLTPGSILIGFSVGEFMDSKMTLLLNDVMGITYATNNVYSLAFVCQMKTSLGCVDQTVKSPTGYGAFLGENNGDFNFAQVIPSETEFLKIYSSF